MIVTDGNGYPGGKGGSGHAEWILSQLPSHMVFIEPFAGKAAITRAKSPAVKTLLCELSSDVATWLRRELPACEVIESCGIELMGSLGKGRPIDLIPGTLPWKIDQALYPFPWWWEEWTSQHVLAYLDPPYVKETRSKTSIYEFEWSDEQHQDALIVALNAPFPVAISGYWSELYSDALEGWTATSTEVQTRGGLRTEHLWRNPLCVSAAAAAPARMAMEYSELGDNWRERDRVSRLVARWGNKFAARTRLEQDAIIRRLIDERRGD